MTYRWQRFGQDAQVSCRILVQQPFGDRKTEHIPQPASALLGGRQGVSLFNATDHRHQIDPTHFQNQVVAEAWHEVFLEYPVDLHQRAWQRIAQPLGLMCIQRVNTALKEAPISESPCIITLRCTRGSRPLTTSARASSRSSRVFQFDFRISSQHKL